MISWNLPLVYTYVYFYPFAEVPLLPHSFKSLGVWEMKCTMTEFPSHVPVFVTDSRCKQLFGKWVYLFFFLTIFMEVFFVRLKLHPFQKSFQKERVGDRDMKQSRSNLFALATDPKPKKK